jgi:hypothetical protein
MRAVRFEGTIPIEGHRGQGNVRVREPVVYLWDAFFAAHFFLFSFRFFSLSDSGGHSICRASCA